MSVCAKNTMSTLSLSLNNGWHLVWIIWTALHRIWRTWMHLPERNFPSERRIGSTHALKKHDAPAPAQVWRFMERLLQSSILFYSNPRAHTSATILTVLLLWGIALFQVWHDSPLLALSRSDNEVLSNYMAATPKVCIHITLKITLCCLDSKA